MSPYLFDAAIAAGSLGLYVVAYAAARLRTRPARVRATAPTPDLGPEPPAVVSLLANRWRVTEDASESTLLDLVARGYLELHQPGNDPRETTIALRTANQDEPLLAYEQRVLARVRDLAVGGVVPVTALTFRNQARARPWNRQLQREVVNDARSRGLSRRRLSPSVIALLSVVAGLSALGIGSVVLRLSARADDFSPVAGGWAALAMFMLLSGLAGRDHGERDTPAGRQVAARWFGVRDWLRGHEEFADLPPAAVTVWDRYLSYGAALGVTHTTSEVLDLGMGDRRLVWSSYGGMWRRVRVRYPRFWPRYGKSVPRMLGRSTVALGFAALLLWLWNQIGLDPPSGSAVWSDLSALTDLGQDPAAGWGGLSWIPLPIVALLLGYGGYVLVRAPLDLLTTRRVTGQVLWLEVWRSYQRKNQRSVPWLDYLAVDEGTAERTRAWGLPRGLAPGLRDGDVVTIEVRPWTRRVVSVTVHEPARSATLTPREQTT